MGAKCRRGRLSDPAPRGRRLRCLVRASAARLRVPRRRRRRSPHRFGYLSLPHYSSRKSTQRPRQNAIENHPRAEVFLKHRGELLSRREVLLAGGAAGITALTACGGGTPVVTPAPSNQIYDTIVIGAGSAGIAAARAVQSSNRSVLVLEAMNRTGGRCWTDTSFAVPYEPGAQFFSQAQSLNTVLYPTAKQLGIATFDGGNVPPTFFHVASGTKATDPEQADFIATYGPTNTALLAYGLGITGGAADQSALQVITDAGLANADYIKLVEQVLISVVDGGDASDQSVEDLYNFSQYSPLPFVYPPGDILFIPRGYGAFLARLANGLPVQV